MLVAKTASSSESIESDVEESPPRTLSLQEYLSLLVKHLRDTKILKKSTSDQELKTFLEDLSRGKLYKYSFSTIQHILVSHPTSFLVTSTAIAYFNEFLNQVDEKLETVFLPVLLNFYKSAKGKLLKLGSLKKIDVKANVKRFLEILDVLAQFSNEEILRRRFIIVLNKNRYVGLAKDRDEKYYFLDLFILSKDSSFGILAAKNSVDFDTLDIARVYLGFSPTSLYFQRVKDEILSELADLPTKVKLSDESLDIYLGERYLVRITSLGERFSIKQALEQLSKLQNKDGKLISNLSLQLKIEFYRLASQAKEKLCFIELELNRLKLKLTKENELKAAVEKFYKQLELTLALEVETFIMRNRSM